MKFNRDMLRLYAVTDGSRENGKSLYQQIGEALEGGVTLVQLREKHPERENFLREAREILELCHGYHVPLIINDHADMAIELGADGVHVGIEDMPVAAIRKKAPAGFIIGATCKTVDQALQAQKEGADYMGVGAVFPSPTKPNAIRLTVDQLRRICDCVSIPGVAIGGITRENIHALRGSHIAGAAVVSALFAAENIPEAAKELRKAVEDILDHTGEVCFSHS